jgi:hypothetical protein
VNLLDPALIPAADGVRFLADQFASHPLAVVDPIVRWVLVPAALLALGLCAAIVLIGRHPGEALPPVDPDPASEVEETVDLSFAARVLAGRVPLDQTVEIRAGRR